MNHSDLELTTIHSDSDSGPENLPPISDSNTLNPLAAELGGDSTGISPNNIVDNSEEIPIVEHETTLQTPRSDLSLMQIRKLKLAFAFLILSTILIIVWYAADNLPYHLIEDACDWIKNNMLIGALLFIPFEVVWTIACIPTTPIELAAGYAFGFGWGFLIDCIAKLIGAALSFLLGRHCLRKCASEDMFEGEKGNLFAAIDAALSDKGNNSKESFKLLLLIQLAYIPVSIKNYGLSFTSVTFSSFISSALIGETPGTLAVTWTGSTTRDLVGLISGDKSSSKTQIIVLVIGLLCLILCMVILGLRIKRRLDETLNVEPYSKL